MISLRRAAALVPALMIGVGACAPTPAPSPSTPPPVVRASSSVPPASVPLSPSPPSASDEPAGDLGRSIDVGRLDTAWTDPTLEFASDGDSVIFSSGVADGSDSEHAPDLWRYRPGAEAPELLWRNPERDRVLPRIGGEFGTWAFVDMPVNGERAWNFWLLPEAGAEPILLDSHPGDESVPDFVPSFTVHQGQVAWTSFDRNGDGSVSQLLYARAPDWTPIVLVERDPAVAELWLPSLRDTDLVYCEVVYAPDRLTDERHVYFMDVATPEVPPRRIDRSGRATMPIALINGGIVWKEADPGFSMFNWGRLFHYDEASGDVTMLPTRPQDYVNYPSAGSRFITAWGADSFSFGVYDLDLRTARLIDRYEAQANIQILRPHISWDLLVWLHAEVDGLGAGPPPQIRYAFLPSAGSDRGRE